MFKLAINTANPANPAYSAPSFRPFRILKSSLKRFIQPIFVAFCIICVYYSLTTHPAPHIHSTIHTFPINHTAIPSNQPIGTNWAIGLKSGAETAIQRVPIQLLTFLHEMPNVFIFAEKAMQVGDIQIIDVTSNLYNDTNKPNAWGVSSPAVSANEINKKSTKDAITPDESRIGWKMDAHKNIPAFERMWKEYPDKEWYIMLDDDTYFNFVNLEVFLSGYDSSQPLYFGNANVFVGCDGVRNFGDGPKFAHGGSGIVISRGAMQKFLPKVPSCIEKYKNCFAGDVRTALCLRDADVLLTELPQNNFNRDPPNSKFTWPDQACALPLTFHHLWNHQIQNLHQIARDKFALHNTNYQFDPIVGKFPTRKQARKLALNYADYFHALASADLDIAPVEINSNRQGSDFMHFVSDNGIHECIEICRIESECRSWVFQDGTCWLKRGLPKKTVKMGVTSGVLLGKYVCKS